MTSLAAGMADVRDETLGLGLPVAQAKSIVHVFSLACVWLTFATSGIVLAEPAPVDAMLLGLLVLLPAVGLTRMTPSLVVFLGAWLIIAAASLAGVTLAVDLAGTLKHIAVSVFLSFAAVLIAAFIAVKPKRHAELVLDGWLWGGAIAALAAIAGYFAVFDGAWDLFTRYGRATGPFKDPNVFGPFLVVPMLYALHRAVTRPLAASLAMLSLAGLLALACLLSFSRGAWASMLGAIALWGALTLATAGRATRDRLLLTAIGGLVMTAAVITFALQTDQAADLLAERATLVQSYDGGPEGRFAGQMKALALIADNPLGIGALSFSPTYHHEEAHSVYLSMMMNAGWIGGGLFLILSVATVALGVLVTLRGGPVAPFLAIATAAFTGNALEGWIIDSDHWRHLYLQMALIWGLTAGTGLRPAATLLRR